MTDHPKRYVPRLMIEQAVIPGEILLYETQELLRLDPDADVIIISTDRVFRPTDVELPEPDEKDCYS